MDLAHQVTLSHRDTFKSLCVYPDTLDRLWSVILTQVPIEDLGSSHHAQ